MGRLESSIDERCQRDPPAQGFGTGDLPQELSNMVSWPLMLQRQLDNWPAWLLVRLMTACIEAPRGIARLFQRANHLRRGFFR
jgi:hypothetical protein